MGRPEEPRLARAIAHWLLPEEHRHFVVADLAEGYRRRRRAGKLLSARRWYWWQVMRAVPASATRLASGVRASLGSAGGDGWWNESRWALRTALRRPGYTAAVMATLGIGLGAAAAILAVANGVWFRPLPFAEPDRIVRVFEVDRNATPAVAGAASVGPGAESVKHWRLSPPLVEDLRHADLRTISAVAAVATQGYEWRTPDRTSRITTVQASPEIFQVLGLMPALGRGFSSDDSPEVLLTDSFWRTVHGADSSAIGSSMILDGISHRIVGVLPPDLPYPADGEVWTALKFDDEQLREGMRGARYLDVVARVRPDVALADAAGELHALVAGLGLDHPNHAGWGATVVDLRLDLIRPYRQAISLLLLAAAVFLLITTVNVAGLAAARHAESAHERAVRAALGAGRGRLLRQAALEGAVPGMLGALLAVALAWWGLTPITRLAPADIPRLDAVGLDVPLLVGLVVGAVLIGSMTALVGQLSSRMGVASAIVKGPQAMKLRHRGRSALLVTQISLATLLLVGGAMLLRHFAGLARTDPGFDHRGLSVASINLNETLYPTTDLRAQFYHDVQSSLAGRGIAAAMAINLPVAGSNMPFGYYPPGDTAQYWGQYHTVSSGYFRIMGIPLRHGRPFTDQDRGGPPMVVVNETLAQQHFPDGDAVGQVMRVVGVERTIVGVVGDTRHFGPDQEAPAELYVPLGQDAWGFAQIVVAGDGPLAHGLVEEAAAAFDPTAAVTPLVPFGDYLTSWFAPLRFQLVIVSVLAAVGTLLGAIGLYGLIAFLVSRRTHELGIRVALGAARRTVAWSVIRQGLGYAVVGIGLGTVAAFTSHRIFESLVPGMGAGSVAPYLAVALVVGLVTVLACAVPARRASTIDPARALRHD